ncbi:MAG: ABC transporter ATP-binding protein [Aquificota bacterium]|nr:MAG: ABC transporter ATP-binding protein [Aquificota bacterium]
MALLKVEDIHTYYGDSYVLQGVSLEVKRGEVVALLGRNGAGKTTTLRTIMGIIKPRRGKILFKGVDITPMPAFKVARMGIGYVPQGRRLFPEMTVLENLKTGMRKKGNGDKLDEIFDLFPALKDRLSQKASTLSGGEQQALSIARALLTEPEILLLDEPTTGLMPLLVSRLREVIEKLHEDGMAILLVEEKVPFALSVAERLYFMVKGKIAYEGSRRDLEDKRDVFIRYLGVKN